MLWVTNVPPLIGTGIKERTYICVRNMNNRLTKNISSTTLFNPVIVAGANVWPCSGRCRMYLSVVWVQIDYRSQRGPEISEESQRGLATPNYKFVNT